MKGCVRGLAVAVLLVVGAGCGGGEDATQTQVSTSVTSTPSAGATPSPTMAPGAVDAKGWPAMGRNQEGTYSWGGVSRCGQNCFIGFMHGANTQSKPDMGDISIVVAGVAGDIEPHEGTSVTVFGYEGSYLRYTGDPITARPRASCERWMVDIEGTTVTVKLCARPGAPADQIREAHDIIESIRVEPRDSQLGFRLVFSLTTDSWDSG